jgi:hypothetical protein
MSVIIFVAVFIDSLRHERLLILGRRYIRAAGVQGRKPSS